MKILVTGASGQLGWALMQRAARGPFTATGADLPEVNLANAADLHRTMRAARPNLVINAAAYTDVDGAESDRERCFLANEAVPRRLAIACREARIPLIHISTDFVFHAPRTTPWTETAGVSPRGVYAESKAAGEAAVQSELDRHLIVRTAWLYGVHGKNFVKTMLSLARDREEIGVVADQVGCPTFAGDLAKALLTIAERYRNSAELDWGIYHYCGGGSTTWHGLAEATIELARQRNCMAVKVRRIRALTTAQYPTPAVRPAYSVLDCRKIQAVFGIPVAHWRTRLETVMDAVIAAWREGR
ncbi:MAG: dTDP-4-dehydrorhamnose reductase [Desulfosarcinaceae bacterium]|nr:dTDP-4-dehydrorhamnose reductase [Desulfosarcinaceae bacterium]